MSMEGTERMPNAVISTQRLPDISRRRVLQLSGAAFVLVSFAGRTFAQAAQTPGAAFVKSAVDQLMAIVNKPGSPQGKHTELTRVVEQNVDINEIAKFSLGRFWRTAAPEQQKQYVTLFHDVLVNNITGKIGDYEGVRLVMGKSQMREDTEIVSTMVERPNNPPTNVDWVLSTASGGPRVIDVIAEGTSLRLTQRQDYAAYLSRNNNNVQALIDAMRQQLAAG